MRKLFDVLRSDWSIARATSSEQAFQDLNKLFYHACAMRYSSLDWPTGADCQRGLVVWSFFYSRNL